MAKSIGVTYFVHCMEAVYLGENVVGGFTLIKGSFRDIRTRDWKQNYCMDNVCCAITEILCGTVVRHWFC